MKRGRSEGEGWLEMVGKSQQCRNVNVEGLGVCCTECNMYKPVPKMNFTSGGGWREESQPSSGNQTQVGKKRRRDRPAGSRKRRIIAFNACNMVVEDVGNWERRNSVRAAVWKTAMYEMFPSTTARIFRL